MKNLFVNLPLILLLALAVVKADLLDCEETVFVPGVGELPEIGPKISDVKDAIGGTSKEHEVRDFFKSFGCQLKKGASKVGEQAKKLGVELKEGAKKLGEKAKVLGSDIKTRFEDFREKLAQDSGSAEELHKERGFLANVEIINPDILKHDQQQQQNQQCGHGHILDALGNCSKLRK